LPPAALILHYWCLTCHWPFYTLVFD
jgi:hypothetical protein